MKAQNTASTFSYLFTVSGSVELSTKAQNAELGGVNIGNTVMPTPFAQISIPSNTVDFNPMTLDILANDNLDEWFKMIKWAFDVTRESGTHLTQTTTAELTILNRQNIPVLSVTYSGVWPSVVGGVVYSIINDEQTVTFQVTLNYDKFDVTNLITGERIEYGSYSKAR